MDSFYKSTQNDLTSYRKEVEQMHNQLDAKSQELGEALDEFQQMLNSTIEAIFITQDEYCIDANEEGIKMYRFTSKKEALGKHSFSFISGESHKKVKEKLAINCTKPFEINAVRNDNSVFPVLVRINTTTRKKKQIRIITILDLTEIKHRDFIISNQAKMVALGEMIENIAHQWRQPLNAITASVINMQIANELNEKLPQKLIDEYLKGIVNSAKYLSATINDFRNFINPQSKKNKIILQDSIEETLLIAKASLDANFINIIKEFEVKPLELNSNASELSQIILNILNNAKSALLDIQNIDRVIKIEIIKGENKAIITIENNGNHIPKDILPKIFNPHFSTRKDKDGTGIGLYMSKELISKHLNGKLYAKNTDNGVKFFIELPLK